jgi:integrase
MSSSSAARHLPWLEEKKRSRVLDAESRVKKLKAFFGNRPLREITRRDVERFQSSLRDKKTKRQTPRKGAAVNRYIYLLSAIFSRATLEEVVDFNPCSRFEQEPEAKRECYLMPAERSKLMDVLVDDLEHLRSPVEVSLGTGVRKITELLQLRIENVNFSVLSVFRRAKGARRGGKAQLVSSSGYQGQRSSSPFDSDECSRTDSIK